MARELKRWLVLALSVLLVGPAVGMLMGLVPTLDGGRAMTALVSTSVGLAAAVTLAALAMGGVWGVVAGKVVGPRDGLFNFGAVMGWGAWTQGRLDELVRAGAGPGVWQAFAIEGLVLGLVAAALAGAGQALSRGDRYDGAEGPGNPSAWVGAGVYVLAGLIGAWALARHESVGQAVVAGCAAGVAGAAAARVVAPRCSVFGLLVGMVGVMTLGPVIGGMQVGGSGFERVVFSGEAPGLLRPLPMAWLSGQLMGMPLGIALGVSLLDQAHAVEGRGATQGGG